MNPLFQRGIFISTLYMIFFIYSFGQQIKNHRKEFDGITKSATNNIERVEKQKRYLESLNEADLIIALSDISKLGDADYIAYNVLPLIKYKFENVAFRKQMTKELISQDNTIEYKAVLIDYLDKQKNFLAEEKDAFADTYFSIANDITLPNRFRQVAASKVAMSSNNLMNKARVKEMIHSDDISLINGASKTIKNYVRSESMKDEIDEWVEELINVLKKNQKHIKELTVPISVLGYTNSSKAREYLVNLFDEHKQSDLKFTETIVYSISNNADTSAINKIVGEYRRNQIYDNYGSELTMMSVANNNIAVVEQLGKSQTLESKTNYLRLIKYINGPSDKQKHIANSLVLLNDTSDEVRFESVKTLRFLLSHLEEEKIFREHLKNEKSQKIRDEIYILIGK